MSKQRGWVNPGYGNRSFLRLHAKCSRENGLRSASLTDALTYCHAGLKMNWGAMNIHHQVLAKINNWKRSDETPLFADRHGAHYWMNYQVPHGSAVEWHIGNAFQGVADVTLSWFDENHLTLEDICVKPKISETRDWSRTNHSCQEERCRIRQRKHCWQSERIGFLR